MSRIHHLLPHLLRYPLGRAGRPASAARFLASTVQSRRFWRRVGLAAAHTGTVLLILSVPAAAFADTGEPAVIAANSLPVVIFNMRMWLIRILLSVATLFLVWSGFLWATAAGDPTQIDKAKAAFRNALIGYAMAVLAPIFLQAVQGIVGG